MHGVYKMKTDDKRIIIPNFMMMLYYLNKTKKISQTELHHESRMTYAHISNLKKCFVKKNWITLEKDGVTVLMSITDKGKEIANTIEKLLLQLDISKEDITKFIKGIKKEEEIIDELIEEEEYNGEENRQTY